MRYIAFLVILKSPQIKRIDTGRPISRENWKFCGQIIASKNVVFISLTWGLLSIDLIPQRVKNYSLLNFLIFSF